MNKNVDKQIDRLTKKVIKSFLIESPSSNFTANIISQVTVFQEFKAETHKPLISKTAWIVIFTVFLTLITFMFFETETNDLGWFNKVDFSILTNNKITDLFTSFSISNTLMYAIIFFGLAWFVQIGLLKSYFNKRLEF